MTKTGWKTPTIVTQNSSKSLNNGRACYPFVKLDNIKKNDLSYADTTLAGGVDKEHASPIVYCNGYNFNIPANATINNIQVLIICQQSTDSANRYHRGEQTSKYYFLKLKTGASTTDYGVGRNLITSDKLLPYKKWSTEDNATFSGSPTQWGVENITPSIVNNSNFGCLIQFKGLYTKAWSTPAIAKVLMNIEYTLPSVTEVAKTIPSETSINVRVAQADLTKLDVSKPNEAITLHIDYTHIGEGGQTPILICSSKDLLIGDEKLKSYTVPTLNLESSTVKTTHTQDVKVYPGTLTGTQTVDIRNNNSYNNLTVNSQDKPPINFNVVNSNPADTYTGISSGEREKYLNGSQRCMVLNSKFEGNHANKNGGAMYILTEHFGRSKNTYTDNSAENSPNIKWNGDSYDS